MEEICDIIGKMDKSSLDKMDRFQYDLKISQNKVELQYYSANFDTLTGIANRFNIMKQLAKIIEVCTFSFFYDSNKEALELYGRKS